MRLVFKLTDLSKTLELLQTTLQDKSAANATSNLAVFEFIDENMDELWVRGFNSYIRVKTKVACEITRAAEDLPLFALDFTQIYMILQTLNKVTNADGSELDVELTLDSETGNVSVNIEYSYEVTIDDETEEHKSRINKKYPAVTKLPSNQLASLAIIEEGETRVLEIAPMLNYIEWFSKLVNVPESYDPRVGKLAFSEDKVYTASNLITAAAPNKVHGVFKNMSFTYTALQLMKRVCTQQADAGFEKMEVLVSTDQTMLTLKANGTEFSVFYFDKVIDYTDFFKSYEKKKSFVIPRALLMNTLKRCSFEKDTVALHYADNRLTLSVQVSSQDFVQVLPTYNSNVDEFRVQVPIELLQKALLGGGTEGYLEIFVDVYDESRVFLILTDGHNTWESVLVLNQRQVG